MSMSRVEVHLRLGEVQLLKIPPDAELLQTPEDNRKWYINWVDVIRKRISIKKIHSQVTFEIKS